MANPSSTGQWYNADGLLVKYGEYYKTPANFVNRSRMLSTMGSTIVIEMDVDLVQLGAGGISYTTDLTNSGTVNGFNIGDVSIPPNSSITAATLIVDTAAAGGTSIIVGTYQANGTAVSNNGIITTTAGAVANLTPSGARVLGDGALLSTTAGTAGTGASTTYIGIKANGTFTAGTARLIITVLVQNVAAVNVP